MSEPVNDIPPHRYDAAMANHIEQHWQRRWRDEHVFEAPNPVGDLSEGFDRFEGKDKVFVLDMFPYPSGSGLHVGHPLGFIGTDVLARFWRMAGRNVLHTMGYDAFGLPAEQYAVTRGQHPRATTEANIANMRRQLFRLGLGHDPRRSIATTDVDYYRWTQWIFLQIFNSWFDTDTGRARPIDELVAELDAGKRSLDDGRDWTRLDKSQRREALLDYRLAYVAEAPVNWCPALGTVLANEEVTNEGRSERGNFPVYKRPMRQWMMRITNFAERLIDDLDSLDWPESVKSMQRNWIGRSVGALADFRVEHRPEAISVFTTRPDTLFGATYVVLAPEHPLVNEITAGEWPEGTQSSWRGPSDANNPMVAVDKYVAASKAQSEIERMNEERTKTGVFTGAYAVNPVNGTRVPIFVADYVLMGYGTGAIMAVPAHDERDFDFATKFSLPIIEVVTPSGQWLTDDRIEPQTPASEWPHAYTGDGAAVHSHNSAVSLDGLDVATAKTRICEWLESQGTGRATVNYRLRDWLFSRQRYWGEPFPIVWDGDIPVAVPDELLPVELPELTDYAPNIVDDDQVTLPEPPLGRAEAWKHVTLDLGDGPKNYRRELNTMPQWAGSCWYYLRYMDPNNGDALVDPANERYWKNVDLYVGGVEHAVLHLLYARFWHKVLYDLGHVTTQEPFQRLFNQGYIQADAFTDKRGIYVNAHEVVEHNGSYYFENERVTRHTGKMGKSLKNSVNPDDIYRDYGADSLRLYEMSMGPLDAGRPWSDQGIVGLYRFLQRVWRNIVDEESGELRLGSEAGEGTVRLLHKTVAAVADDITGLRFNTAIAKLIELNNHITKNGTVDRNTAETLALMLAPFAPHIAEELWAKLGYDRSLTWEPFPKADPAMLVDDTVEIPIQVQGKVRAKITVPFGAPAADVEAIALGEPNVARHLEGREVKKVLVVTDRMVNIVLA